MATAAWKAGTALIPLICLLALAGAGSALAQLDCPLPAGVTPPSNPQVTAQQVEDGSASLTDFALSSREHAQGSTSVEQAAYVGCLLRQEGSPWRSGSTYLVQLTPDGRVFVHAKDMSLSGRQLRPVIYGAVLRALGIDPAALADPGAAQAAFAAAAERDGGLFDVPGFAGASGHASAYSSSSVVLTGFDLGEPHLVPVSEEDIDYGDPPVAAVDVVDRSTLKAFGTAAGAYVVDLLETGDLAALSKARIALRDPNGPWRHGPVYLGVVERVSELILFHGAFPDRFEFRQGGVARDAATGELVFDQLIAAAESGPEGGYWLYHFDSPVDDTDSEDVPKLGYARVVTATIPLPDGSAISSDLIINTGFYLTSDSVFVERLLGALADGQTSVQFGMTSPEDGAVVAGDAVEVLVEGAPTDTVHFAYRLAGLPEEPFTYLGAATNREGMASFAWDTLDLPDDDYELVALYTEDDGTSVTYDHIEVSVDNVGGDGEDCEPDGDINRDGHVTAEDALMAFSRALNLTTLDACQEMIGDVFPSPTSPDGIYTAADALCIFSRALGLPSCLDALVEEVGKGDLIMRVVDGTDPELPGHLDLLELAVYESTYESTVTSVIFEITTRENHRVGQFYRLHFDTDEPYWGYWNQDNDNDFSWGFDVEADGNSIWSNGPVTPELLSLDGNRLTLLADVGEGFSASVIAGVGPIAGEWQHSDTSKPSVVDVDGGGEPHRVNQPPVVNAGSAQSVDAGAVVTLSGTASDPDGYITSYLWEQTGGRTVSLVGDARATATFTAPEVRADETLTFRLTVSDNQGAQAMDEVRVTVERFYPDRAFVAISAGLYHACGVRDTGAVECWGDNERGQASPPAGTFIQVSAGYLHTCGVRETGEVACWGYNPQGEAAPPAGTFAQVSAGNGYTCGVRDTGDVACWGRVNGGQATPPVGSFIQVSAEQEHTCGVRETGEVACWGRNDHGQSTPPAGIFVQISAGVVHTCGVRETGEVACWGSESYGGGTPPAGIFTQVSAGGHHTCAVRETGEVACWGYSPWGEAAPPAGTFAQVSAGNGYTCGVRDTSEVVCWGDDKDWGQATPPAGTFTQVSGRWREHTCGVRDTGEVACWGGNDYGQSTPPAGIFTQVSAGWSHTCGVRDTGDVACWGSDIRGRATPPAGIFTQVSAGAYHTCGVRETGDVACWGSDIRGRATPPAGIFVQVSVGWSHTCGVRETGEVACWGQDLAGQSTPPAGIFTQVSAGEYHTCGVRETGEVACWGALPFWASENGEKPGSTNQPPIVNAGADQTVENGSFVTLSGTASDPDGYIVSYQWEQTSGATVSLSDAMTSTAFFTASDVTADTMLTFRLTVTDDTGVRASDDLTVMVRAVNLASLKVSVFGEGNLRIVGAGQLDCTAITICQGMFGMGSAVVIEAKPDSGWGYEGWVGCDETSGSRCTLFVDGDRFVSVAFLSTDPPELEDDVIVLSDDQLAELIEYDIAAGLLVFGPGTPGAGQWAIGDILLSDGIGTPFARRIRNIVSVPNSPYYIHTTQASLDDIFRAGSLSYHAQAQEVTPSSASAPRARGPVVTQSGDTEYPLQVNVYMPFGDNVTVSGTIKFSVQPEFHLDFRPFGLEEARFITHAGTEGSLAVRMAAGVEIINAEKALPLAIYLPPIPLFTGIWVTPIIEAFLTVSVEASASITPRAIATIWTKAGAHYKSGRGTTPIFSAEADVDFDLETEVTTALELKAEPGIRGEVQLKVNNLIGPHVGFGPFFGVRTGVVATECAQAYAEVYGGARLAVGGELEILGWGVRYDIPLWERAWNFGTISLRPNQGADSMGLVTGLRIADRDLDSLTLDWPVPANNCGLVGYNVYRDDRAIAREISTTSFMDGQLTPGREYCYRVSAVGVSGAETPRSGVVCGSTDNPTEGDAPESPINVAVMALSTSAMTVMWDPPFDEGAITGYVVYDHSGSDIYAIGSVDADTISFDVVSLKPDSEYCFSVGSVSAVGTSDSSAVVCASTLDESESEWTMYLGCVNQPPFIEESIDLDQRYTSRVTVLGTGSQYDGQRLAYTLSGTYDAEFSVLDGSIHMSLEANPDARRVDEFSVELSSGDSGRVSMRLVERTTSGCIAYIRLVESAVSADSPVVARADSANGATISHSGVGLFEGM